MDEQTVGVRELKEHLSSICGRSEESHVGHHGARKANRTAHPPGTVLAERMEELQRAGLIRWNGRKLHPAKPIAKLRGKKTIAQIIIEDRR
jgi:hypothetical protein